MTFFFPTQLTWKHCLPVSIVCHAIALATLWALPEKTQSFQPLTNYPEEIVTLAQDILPPIFIDEPVAQDIPDSNFDPFEQPELPDIRPTGLFFEETPQASSDDMSEPQAPSQLESVAAPKPDAPIPDAPAQAKAETPGSHDLAQGSASSSEGGTVSGTATGSGAAIPSGTSSQSATSGNGHASPAVDENALWKAYATTLNAHFKKFKHYPVIAKKRRMTGTVIIQITLDRAGNVLDSQILQSSGQSILDEAALASAKDASPAPPFPEALSAQTRKIEIPYSYSLK